MNHEFIKQEKRDKVLFLEFSNPKKRNALSQKMLSEIMEALEEDKPSDTRVVIIRAPKGSAVFSSGHDLGEFPPGNRDPFPYGDHLREAIRAIQVYPKPVIAMVEGTVWGAAFEMIMATDIIVAANDTTFAMTPANFSLAYNLAGINNLTHDSGFHMLKELLFTAAPIDCERALSAGILNHAVPREKLEEFTLDMANLIAAKAPLAITAIKEGLRVLGEARAMNSDVFEHIQNVRRIVYDSHDYLEGIEAFRAKRKPIFNGK